VEAGEGSMELADHTPITRSTIPLDHEQGPSAMNTKTMIRSCSRVAMSLALLSGFTAASSAQEPQPSLADVLKSVQGMRQELRSLREEVERLKRSSQPAAAASPAPAASVSPAPQPVNGAKVATAAPQGRLEPGWVVNVFLGKTPYDSTPGQDSIGSFVYQGAVFNSMIHQKSVPTSSPVLYRADGFFRAKEQGRYVFITRVEAESSSFRCAFKLKIDDTEVFASEFKYWQNKSVVQGGIDLDPGNYRISFVHACDRATSTDDGFVERSTGARIQVRGPDDTAPHDLTSNELVHITRAR
jgi:hypothetical protein